jgi:hypothetical protein
VLGRLAVACFWWDWGWLTEPMGWGDLFFPG